MDYPRSHTDPLANLVVISPLDIRRHLQEIVERDFPIGSLPTFLHEVTHHWCFDSPVGTALHLLFLRARRSALLVQLGSKTRDAAWEVLNDVVRYEAALGMTRPLSEGLALFAEHDAIPGHTQTISTPMQLAAGMYARGLSVRDPEKPYDGLGFLLAAGRVSRNHVRRKADLLIQPMRCDEGGYLPGYLLVKLMWRAACENSKRFLDTDFFLQYLHHCLFHDWGLVARLLDDSMKDIDVLDPLGERINSRLRAFIETTTADESAAEFERVCERGEMRSLKVRTPVVHSDVNYLPWGDDAEAALGRARLKEHLESFFTEWPEHDVLRAMMHQDVSDLALRAVVNLGHTRLEAREGSDVLELHSDERLLFTVPKERLRVRTAIEGAVDVDVVATRVPGSLHIVLMKEPRLLTCLSVGSYELPESLLQLMSARANRAANAEQWQQLITSALAKDDLIEHVEVVRNTIRHSLNQRFVPAALMRADPATLPALMEETATDGLLPLLHGELGLLLDAAAASLCLPSPFNFRALDSFHRWSQSTPKSSLETVNRLLGNRLGFAPFLIEEGIPLPISLI